MSPLLRGFVLRNRPVYAPEDILGVGGLLYGRSSKDRLSQLVEAGILRVRRQRLVVTGSFIASSSGIRSNAGKASR